MPAYSGLYDGVYGTPHSLLSDAVAIGNAQTQIARVLAKRPYGRGVLRELMLTLNGAAAGSAASDTHKRVDHVAAPGEGPNGGGLVAIETFTGISRNTTAGDKTDIDRMLALSSKPTYVSDASNNGGGGKLGY